LVNQKIAPGLDAGFRSKLIWYLWIIHRKYKDHWRLREECTYFTLDDCYEKSYDLCLTAMKSCPWNNWGKVPSCYWDKRMIYAVMNTLLMRSCNGMQFDNWVTVFGGVIGHVRGMSEVIFVWEDDVRERLKDQDSVLETWPNLWFAVRREGKHIVRELEVPYMKPQVSTYTIAMSIDE